MSDEAAAERIEFILKRIIENDLNQMIGVNQCRDFNLKDNIKHQYTTQKDQFKNFNQIIKSLKEIKPRNENSDNEMRDIDSNSNMEQNIDQNTNPIHLIQNNQSLNLNHHTNQTLPNQNNQSLNLQNNFPQNLSEINMINDQYRFQNPFNIANPFYSNITRENINTDANKFQQYQTKINEESFINQFKDLSKCDYIEKVNKNYNQMTNNYIENQENDDYKTKFENLRMSEDKMEFIFENKKQILEKKVLAIMHKHQNEENPQKDGQIMPQATFVQSILKDQNFKAFLEMYESQTINNDINDNVSVQFNDQFESIEHSKNQQGDNFNKELDSKDDYTCYVCMETKDEVESEMINFLNSKVPNRMICTPPCNHFVCFGCILSMNVKECGVCKGSFDTNFLKNLMKK